MRLNRLFWPAVACVIAIAGTLEVRSAQGETQTWDEGIHIAAGYAYLTRGDYRWNDEHPPLAKLMSALPLKRMGLVLPVEGEAWRKNDEVRLGIEFLYQSPVSADRILFAARSMTMLLSLLFLGALAWWTRRRFGAAAALLAREIQDERYPQVVRRLLDVLPTLECEGEAFEMLFKEVDGVVPQSPQMVHSTRGETPISTRNFMK